jgi:hypothetical protein
VVSGFIIQSLGVGATFGISAIIYCVLFPLIYFVVVETTYNKPRQDPAKEGDSVSNADEPKEIYRQRLRVFRGRVSENSFWRGILKPFPLIAYPAVLFSTIVYASFFAWLLSLSLLAVTIFSSPPYNLNPAQVGLTNLPLFAVALISSLLSGWAADGVAKFLARKNGGIFEPEFRLTLMLVAIPLSTTGFIGFGESVRRGLPLQWPLTFMSLHAASVPFAQQASLAYVIDCHKSDANLAFVTINFAKATMVFVCTSYVNGLYFKFGPRVILSGMALLNLGISLLTVPSYVFGKRLRSMVSGYSIPNSDLLGC